MGSFLDSLKSNINRVQTEVNDKINTVAYTLFYRIVGNSPHVGDGPYVAGQFVANWFPAVNGFDASTTGAVSDGGDSLARIDAVVKSAKAFMGKDGFISLSNNLSYAFRVEYSPWGQPAGGWPAGTDPLTGWHWTGMRQVYSPVSTSILNMKADLK